MENETMEEIIIRNIAGRLVDAANRIDPHAAICSARYIIRKYDEYLAAKHKAWQLENRILNEEDPL